MNDREFLLWMVRHLHNEHGEDPNVDYMSKLYSIALAVPGDQKTPNTKNPSKFLGGDPSDLPDDCILKHGLPGLFRLTHELAEYLSEEAKLSDESEPRYHAGGVVGENGPEAVLPASKAPAKVVRAGHGETVEVTVSSENLGDRLEQGTKSAIGEAMQAAMKETMERIKNKRLLPFSPPVEDDDEGHSNGSISVEVQHSDGSIEEIVKAAVVNAGDQVFVRANPDEQSKDHVYFEGFGGQPADDDIIDDPRISQAVSRVFDR